jgi:L-fuculose-phosphate aldolase
MMINEFEKTKADVASFMRRLYQQRLTTTSGGNISARCGNKIFITPSGTDKGLLKSEDIGIMTIEGVIVGETFKPTIESEIHLGIYRTCSDVNAIVHAHPIAASAFAASRAPIKTCYHAEAHVILGEIGYVAYCCPGTPELAGQVAIAVNEHNCVLLRNHGALCVGGTLLQAFDRLEVLETAARINLIMKGALKNDAVELNNRELQALECFL